jgi:hypothetical protein
MTVCPYCRQVDSHACNCWHPNPQSVPTCTCSKHPLWDGYDGDCPIHGWFEPVAPGTPQSVPEEITIEGERYRWNKSEKLWVICTPDAPLSQGGERTAEWLEYQNGALTICNEELRKQIASLSAMRDKLKKALLESVEENLWDAYSRGIERDGKWTTAGMSDAEWLARMVGLDPHARHAHDAEAVKAAIPEAAKVMVEELK